MHRLLALVVVLGLAGAPAAVAGSTACTQGNYDAALKVQEAETAPGANVQPASATDLTRTSTGVYVLDVALGVDKIVYTPVKSLQLASMQPGCSAGLSSDHLSITCGGFGAGILPIPLATCGDSGAAAAAGTAVVDVAGATSTISVPNKSPSASSGGSKVESAAVFHDDAVKAHAAAEAALTKEKAARTAHTAAQAKRDFHEITELVKEAGVPLTPWQDVPAADRAKVEKALEDLNSTKSDLEKMEMTVEEEQHFTPAEYAPELTTAEDDTQGAADLIKQVM